MENFTVFLINHNACTYMYLIYLIFHGRARMKWGSGILRKLGLSLHQPKTSFEERVRANKRRILYRTVGGMVTVAGRLFSRKS